MKEVVPRTYTSCPAAPLTATFLPSLIDNPCASTHAVVARVIAAPVSTIMCPLVGPVFWSSHLETGLGLRMAISMWGYCIDGGGATVLAASTLPDALRTYLIVAAPHCFLGAEAAAMTFGRCSSTFLATSKVVLAIFLETGRVVTVDI